MRRSLFNGFTIAAGAVLVAALGVSAHAQISNVFRASSHTSIHSDVASGARESPEPSDSPEPAESPKTTTTEPAQQPETQENDDNQGQNKDDQGDKNDQGDNGDSGDSGD